MRIRFAVVSWILKNDRAVVRVVRTIQYNNLLFCLLFIIYNIELHEDNGVRQVEIHKVEPLVPEPSAFEFELAIGKLKNHKSPGIDEIRAELIKAGGRTTCCGFINLLFLFGIRRNCLKNGRSRS